MRVFAAADPAPLKMDVATLESERATLRLEVAPANGAVASPAGRRRVLERELDRVQQALMAERQTFGQELNWLMLSQALMLNAFLFVLILGWSTPLPAKRWLLAGIAIFAALVAVLIYAAQRGSRDAMSGLRTQRREIEASLQREFGRAPTFASGNHVIRSVASFATGLLPLSFIGGWIVVTIYSLAAPLNSNARTEAPTSATAPATATARNEARAPAAAPSSPPRASVNSAVTATPGSASLNRESAPVAEPAPKRPASGGFKW